MSLGFQPLGRMNPIAMLTLLAACALSGFAGVVLAGHGVNGAGQVLHRPTDRSHTAELPGDGHVSGTGFAVAPGYVVTNAHVTMRCVAGNLPLMVAGHEDWRVVSQDPTLDLALLQGGNGPPPLRLSASARLAKGTRVVLMGFPLAARDDNPRLRTAQGQVRRAALTVHQAEAGHSVSFSAVGPGGREIDPSWADGIAYFGERNAERLRWIVDIAAPADHGDSGGPVLDEAGNVVGVIFAGDAALGVSSAVTLDDLREFLIQSNIIPAFGPPAGTSMRDKPSLLNEAARGVVRVGC